MLAHGHGIRGRGGIGWICLAPIIGGKAKQSKAALVAIEEGKLIMHDPEEWTETVNYQVTHREEVWKVLEYPYWLMRTRRTTYFLFGPGFIRPDSPWIAGWQSNHNRRNAFDGSVEAETIEEVVKDLPYRVAVALLDAVKADPPVVHGASRYDHQGCRCDVCKAAKAAKQKEARERKKVSA